MDRLKELRDQQAQLIRAGEEILKDASRDGWDDERQANFDRTHEELGDVGKMIDAVMAQREASAAAAERMQQRVEDAPTPERREHALQRADDPGVIDRLMFKYLRDGFEGFTPEDRQVYAMHVEEQRQQGTTPDSAGGFVVGEEFFRQIEDAMKMYAGIRNVATVLRTATGEPMHFPQSDGTAEVGEIIAENTAHNQQDLTFTELVLESFQYSSGIVKSSRQLLQDSFVSDLTGFFAKRIGERIGRIQATHFTVGTGTGQPQGIVTASTLGHTAGSATVITTDDLLALMHAVDPAYALTGTWGMNWTTLGQLRGLSDADGFPIWNPVQDSTPGSLYGRPIQILQDMATPASTTLPIIYGALDKYLIRDAGGLSVYRSEHRYFELNQLAWLGIQRSDGDLNDAGSNPVQHMAMAV